MKKLLLSLVILLIGTAANAAFYQTTAVYPTSNAVVFTTSPNATAVYKIVNGTTAAAPVFTSGNVAVVNATNASPLFVSPNNTAVFKLALATTANAQTITDDDQDFLEMDDSTWALNTIDYAHHEVHAGSSFYVKMFETLADDATVNFSIKTSNTTKWAHMTWQVEGTSQTEMLVYEGAVVEGGTATTPLNHNRNSATTASVAVSKNPTVTSYGTLIYSASHGKAGTTPAVADNLGNVKRELEIILKQNTQYMFLIISRDNDNIVSYDGEWYEHTNK